MAKKRVAVGLDIGATALRAAEMSSGPYGGEVELLRYAEVPLPPNAVRDGEVVDRAVVTQALKTLWTQADFSTKDVILSVGNQRVAVRPISLPKMPMDELQRSLQYQVQESLPMPVDEAVLSFLPTYETQSEAGPTFEGMLVAAWRESIMNNVSTAEAAGLNPMVIDLSAFALLRAMARGPLATGTIALVDIGARITTVVVATDGVPRFVRALSSGAQELTETLARSLGMPLEDAERIIRSHGLAAATAPEFAAGAGPFGDACKSMVEGVRSSIGFYTQTNPQAPVQVVVLTGGGALVPGLGQTIASATRTRAQLGNPLEGLRLSRRVSGMDIKGREGTMAMPIGLGLGVAA